MGEPLRGHEPRIHDGDGHPVGLQLVVQGLGERHDGVLRCRVDGGSRDRVPAGQRGHVHHVPLGPDQEGKEDLRAPEHGQVVGGRDPVHLRKAEVVEPAARRDAGVVHQDVTASVPALDLVAQGPEVLLLRDVARHGQGLPSLRREFRGDLPQPLLPAGGEDDGRTRPGEGAGRGRADPAGCPGHHDDPRHGTVLASVCPPSTMTTEPVMKEEASEARKSATPAISSGLPHRPIGIMARMPS